MRSLFACTHPPISLTAPNAPEYQREGSGQCAPPGRASPEATNVLAALKWFPAGGNARVYSLSLRTLSAW